MENLSEEDKQKVVGMLIAISVVVLIMVAIVCFGAGYKSQADRDSEQTAKEFASQHSLVFQECYDVYHGRTCRLMDPSGKRIVFLQFMDGGKIININTFVSE